MPRYKVTVTYSGFENTFETIDPSIQFSLSIGDKAVVYLDPKNPKNTSLILKRVLPIKVNTPQIKLTLTDSIY